jgi:hypothetical protein
VSSELRFPPGFKSDDEFAEVAFADWKIEHGLGDSIRMGDLDFRSLGQVMQRAQQLKTRAREKTA